MTYGPQIAATADGKGLIMSYYESLYSFDCDTYKTEETRCYWSKVNYELKTRRHDHIMIPVPSSFVEC